MAIYNTELDGTIIQVIEPDFDSSQNSDSDEEEQYQEVQIAYSFSLQALVDKVRKIVKFFKKSPKQNDQLIINQEVQFMRKKELNPLFTRKARTFKLSQRTRWRSLFNMLSRFSDLYCYADALIPQGLQMSRAELEEVKKVVVILGAADRCNGFLMDSKTNTYNSITAIYRLLQMLGYSQHPLAAELTDSLKHYLKRRHTTPFHTLIEVMENPRKFETVNENMSMVKECFVNLCLQLYDQGNHEQYPDSSQNILRNMEFEFITDEKETLQEELKYLNHRLLAKKFDLMERNQHGATGVASLLKECLRNIPGTSVFCQQIFSIVSTRFIKKARSSLKDQLVEALLFVGQNQESQ